MKIPPFIDSNPPEYQFSDSTYERFPFRLRVTPIPLTTESNSLVSGLSNSRENFRASHRETHSFSVGNYPLLSD